MKNQILITLIAIGVLVVLIVYTQKNYHPKDAVPTDVGAAQNYEEGAPTDSNSETTTSQSTTPINTTETTTASGLKITITKEGAGAPAVAGNTVTVHYTGMFTDGKVFDSSVGKQPFSFQLGAHMVIAGWDEGVAGMKVGEKRHLVIPANIGYGPNGYGPIPGNATLVFDVELLAIK
jgi:FKBP-type peptidyl-prolyl cis-trans isomerase